MIYDYIPVKLPMTYLNIKLPDSGHCENPNHTHIDPLELSVFILSKLYEKGVFEDDDVKDILKEALPNKTENQMEELYASILPDNNQNQIDGGESTDQE